MPRLRVDSRLPYRPSRVLVAGTSGSGKSTLARHISTALALPYTEIDALFHGPDWTPRSSFDADVRQLVDQPAWVTEYQYGAVRPLLLARCDLLVALTLPRSLVMARVIRRTVQRSLRHEELWNGNVEPRLRTIFADHDHIVRWAWRTHTETPKRVAAAETSRPDLPVVVLTSRGQVRDWVAGPLTAAALAETGLDRET